MQNPTIQQINDATIQQLMKNSYISRKNLFCSIDEFQFSHPHVYAWLNNLALDPSIPPRSGGIDRNIFGFKYCASPAIEDAELFDQGSVNSINIEQVVDAVIIRRKGIRSIDEVVFFNRDI